MESGGEPVDDHAPGWVPVKKKHRSGSKFSVQSWAGGFSGKDGSSHRLPMSSVSAKFAKFAGKHKPHISKDDSKNSKSVPYEGDNGKATTNKSASLSRSRNSLSPPKPPESNVSSNIPVSDGNLELLQKDEPEMAPKIKWGDFDDDDVSTLYPGTMHEGSVNSYGSKNSSLVDFDNETSSRLTSHSFSCSDLRESKSVVTAVTAVTVDSYPSLASKEEKIENNSDESSPVSLPEVDAPIMESHFIDSDNVSGSGKTCELRHDCSKIGVSPCEEIDMGVQVPKLVHDSGIQEVPKVGEVSALNSCFSFAIRNECEFSVDDPHEGNMPELSTSPVEKLSNFEIPLEGGAPFTSESHEDCVSDTSSSPAEKLSAVVTCQSPFVPEENKQAVSDSSVTTELPEFGEVSALNSCFSFAIRNECEISVDDPHEGNMPELSTSPVERLGTFEIPLEGGAPFTSESHEDYVSDTSSSPVEKPSVVVTCQSPFVPEGNKQAVSDSSVTTEKSGMVTPHQLPLLPISEGINVDVSESRATKQESGMVIPLISEGDESLVSDKLLTTDKSGMVADPELPTISEGNKSSMLDPPVAIGKSVFVDEPPPTLVSEGNESSTSVSPVTVIEPELLITKGNESTVSPSPMTVGKSSAVVEPQVPDISEGIRNEKSGTMVEPSLSLIFEEKDFRVSESLVTTKKVEDVVVSPLLLTSEAVIRVSDSAVALEKSETLVEPPSPLLSEANESRVSESYATTKNAELGESPVTAEELDSRDPVELPSFLVSDENESKVSESSVTTKNTELAEWPVIAEELASRDPVEPPSPLVSEENESGVSESSVTTEKAELAESPLISKELDSRDPVEPLSPLVSEENESKASESSATTEKPELAESPLTAEEFDFRDPVEPPSPLVSEENESGVSESSATSEKAELDSRDPVEPLSPLVSEENESRVSESSATTEKAELDSRDPVEPLSPLVSEENESRVSESSATTEKAELAESPFISQELNSRDPVEPPSPLVSEDDESRVSESSVTSEKAEIAESPLIAVELDPGDPKSPVATGKSDIAAESKLSHIFREKELRASEVPVTIEKSATVVEPLLPQSSKVNESRVSDSPRIVEKVDLVVETQLPLISKENDTRASVSPVTAEILDTVVESQLPCASEESELTVSTSAVPVVKSDTFVETQFPLVSGANEWRDSESPVKIEQSGVVAESLLPLFYEENKLRVAELPATFENSDIVIESQMPSISKDNQPRALESPLTSEKSETRVESQLPVMSEEIELKVAKSAVINKKYEILVDSHISPVSDENEFRAPSTHVIGEKLDMVVSQLPTISNENEFSISGSPVTVGKSDVDAESQLPMISTGNESRMCEPYRTAGKSDAVVELLPLCSKDEYSASELHVTVERTLPILSEESESRVSGLSVDKSAMVAEIQTLPITYEGDASILAKSQTKTSVVVFEPQVCINCKEKEAKVSDPPVRVEISGTAIEPQSDQLPLSYEKNQSGASEPPPLQIEKSSPVTTQIETESGLLQNCESEAPKESSAVAKVHFPAIPEEIESSNSEVSGLNPFSTEQDSNSLTPQKCGHEIPVSSSQMTSVGNNEASFGRPVFDGLHKVLKQSDPIEGDVGESKERFRERLWCFLFENLNKSVDELYLLCELECDLDQMKEAVLVLEEAASDFNELTTRVQEFDKVKRSSQSVDGAMSTLKSDHRRPHALSWEAARLQVRRMTTSPHRADILSSSLEAFKKIQQERANMLEAYNSKNLVHGCSSHHVVSTDLQKSSGESVPASSAGDSVMGIELGSPCVEDQKQIGESGCCSEVDFIQNGDDCLQSVSGVKKSRVLPKEISTTVSGAGGSKRVHELEKLIPRKDKSYPGNISMRTVEINDQVKKQAHPSEKDKERRNSFPFKSMDAWKERRNWAEILSTPSRTSSRISHSPGLNSKSAERARVLHDKLMSPEKKKKTALDLKKEAEEKHARARRIRNELENERVQKLQRTSQKLNRMNEWQAVRTMKLREGMHARHQRSESRHEAHLAQVARRAGDESSKVNEVRFITSLNEENKKLMLRQKLHDSEMRRAEKLEVKKSKQKEDMAREEAVLERRKLIEAEKLQRLAETQRRKEEAQIRREVERKASSAAREARAMEQLRKREERAKAQQEEAEMLAQKLAERLRESEQRRKFYLEQIRERASMDFRDQSSPLLRRSVSRDGQGRSTVTSSGEDCQEQSPADPGSSGLAPGNTTQQNSLKRQIKKIRQRLMALKYDFIEPPISSETSSFAYRTAVGTARVKIGRWIQELQRLRQARKEGASSIGLTIADMIKFLEGRDPELQASRQAGLLDFIASALPASHTSKPEACQVTVHFLKLLRVVLSMSTNRSYFLAQNLLPPIVPMLSAALENYIKNAASSNASGCATVSSGKPSIDNVGSASEVLDNFLWIVGALIGHTGSDERENHMQDGLIELLTAYRVIHRLRDLFVLYDRPQVEGLPFPSSILLGVHLLVVLTYKARSNSSINLESSSIGMMLENSKFGNSSNGITACEGSSLSEQHGSQGVTSPDPPVDGSCSIAKGDEPESVVKDGETSQTHCSVELNGGCAKLANAPGETQILTEEKCAKQSDGAGLERKNHNILSKKQPVADLLSAISETGLVSLPSLITSVLLQTSPRPFSEQGSYILPSNFEEVATGVLKVLNNLALMDVSFIQRMLAMPDLKMEFFHLMSFLLSHCTSKWRGATDQIGLLLLESLLLLGHFALLHPENQAVLRWGKSPTILHKVCDLPFAFFSDPNLMPILAGTLVAACYACEQNKSVVQQELCVDMLLSLLKSCRKSNPPAPAPAEDCSASNQHGYELRKSLGENPLKPSRNYVRPGRLSLGSSVTVSSIRSGKPRSQRDARQAPGKSIMGSEELGLGLKQSVGAPEASAMLHCRFSSAFIDKAEHFFSEEESSIQV
ncbi:S phase cyclin A-associated protein in the endoplasmic reticulum [Linum grandiflorum]